MGAIINFFESIASGVTAALDWFVGFLGDLVYLVEITGKSLAEIPGYFSWLPSEMVAMIVSIFTIVVLYKILGREG